MNNKNQNDHDSKMVDEAGRESFPASDPPAWTTGIEKKKPEEKSNEKYHK